MKKDQKIQINKLRPVANPVVPTPSKEDYAYGQINPGVSIPSDYIASGTLLDDVVVGQPLEMLRSNRNGVESMGFFSTSAIVKIEGKHVYTQNSVYKVTII